MNDGTNYYKLSKEKRWLDECSPYEIGGRDTDIAQIGYSLMQKIKDSFPINGVPEHIRNEVDTLIKKLEDEEESIQQLILNVAKEIK